MIIRYLFFVFLCFVAKYQIEGNKCVEYSHSETKRLEGKVKWAIVALTKYGAGATRARDESILKLITPFADKYEISILYFSELDLSQEVKTWQKIYQNYAKVKYINTAQHGFQNSPQGKFGYKYMCKFFALDIYSHLREYDYYLRCDTDCKMKAMKYDLFQYVQSHSIEYGYALRKIEAHKITRETLVPFTQEYLQKCQFQPSSLMDEPLTTCFNFYNNFHIAKVSFFLRPDVQHYLHAVNSTGRILSDRWGDSTIQAYAVRLFMHPARVQLIPNFSYVHGSHNGFISTFSDGRKSNIPQTLPPWTYKGN